MDNSEGKWLDTDDLWAKESHIQKRNGVKQGNIDRIKICAWLWKNFIKKDFESCIFSKRDERILQREAQKWKEEERVSLFGKAKLKNRLSCPFYFNLLYFNSIFSMKKSSKATTEESHVSFDFFAHKKLHKKKKKLHW